MCDACDRGISSEDPVQFRQWRDQQDARIREAIRREGWYFVGVEEDEARARPPFAYTIGLTGLDHPELVVFGLDPEISRKVLRALARRVLDGSRLDEGDGLQLPVWTSHLHLMELRMLAMPRPEQVLLWTAATYGPQVPITALQVAWDDGNGRFPWEPGYELAAWLQPMPGTFVATP